MKYILLLILFSSFASASSYKPGHYKLDPMHSRMSFTIDHFVVSEVEGRFNEVNGEIILKNKFSDSTFNATIPVHTIDTAVVPRDNHLRSADFFDADKYPYMNFKTKRINSEPPYFEIIGDLTIKNVTKEVRLKAKYTGAVTDPKGEYRVAFQAEGKIKRKDFNINYNEKIDLGPAVGEEVRLKLWTEAILIKN